MQRRAVLDVLLVVLSAASVYSARHTCSVGAVAYTSVVILQIAFDDQRMLRGAKAPRSVHRAVSFLAEVLVKVSCSLFACGALVLFNHEEVIV